MKFRKDINGLRAIAVIAVVLFHFNESWVPGGFAGVDVFFVISGFLMTGIIFKGIEQRNFSILKFYVARANRIIPALAVLCLVLIIFGWFYLTPLDYKILSKHIISSMGFFSNVIYLKESGYFDAASHEKWLLHTWSLSAEWQFYMIYPLLVVAMRNFMSLEQMKTVILTATILGFIFCAVATIQQPNSAYYLLPTRAWEMMIGGVAYLYPLHLNNYKKRCLEWFGLALIISSYVFVSEESLWPGYLALIPVMGSFFIIQAQQSNSIITGNVIFQKLGKWSYSIYLWHWPLVVAIYYYSLSDIYILFGMVLTLFLGFISNKYIESINFRNNFSNLIAHTKSKPIIISFLIGLFGSLIFITDGAKNSLRKSLVERGEYLDKYSRQNYVTDSLHDAYGMKCDFFDPDSYTAKKTGIPETCINNGEGGIFIWGDSHAQALSYGIRNVFYNVNINQVATSACRPSIKKDIETSVFKISCNRSNDFAKKAILKIEPDVIILAQADNHDKNEYNDILSYIRENNLKSKLFLVGPVPQWRPSLPLAITRRHFDKNNKIISDPSFVSKILEINNHLHIKYDGTDIHYVSLVDNLCNREGCLAKVDDENTPLVWDYGHLTLEGSIYIASKIKNKIENEIK